MQFSLLDLKLNGTCDLMNFTISPNWCCYTTLWKSKHRKCHITADITKENCIRCIIASSMCTRAIVYLKFTHTGCYTAKRARCMKQRFMTSTTCENAWCNLCWLWPEHHRCWRDHLCMLVMDTLNTCSDMNVHLYDSPEHFTELPM